MGGSNDPVGFLKVKVCEARGLIEEVLIKRNPFCEVTFEGTKFFTSVVKNNLNPHWNEEFTFELFSNTISQSITFIIWDKTFIQNKHLGQATVPLSGILGKNKTADKWAPLEKSPKKKKSKVNGQLHFIITIQSQDELEDFIFPVTQVVDPNQDWYFLESNQAIEIKDLDNNNYHSVSKIDNYTINNESKPSPSGETIIEKDIFFSQSKHENGNGNGNHNDYNINNYSNNHIIHDNDVEFKLEEMDEEALEKKLEEEEQERLLREFLANESKCINCHEDGGNDLFELNCDHKLCRECLKTSISNQVNNSGDPICPIFECNIAIAQWVLKKLMNPIEFDNYINKSLQIVLENNSEMFKCPNSSCKMIIERVKDVNIEVSQSIMGTDGKPLSQESIEHRSQFRFRCRSCGTEFCSSCMKTPYHLGYTCDQHNDYLKSRHCRFCKTPISDTQDALFDLCDEEECQEKWKNSCRKSHECGHQCCGIKDEEKCLPCLHLDCQERQHLLVNGEDLCNICWVEDLESAPSVQLECGHFFHYDCVVRNLRQKWPSARITFGFWLCPLCKVPMKHKSLEEELQPISELYEDIKTKAMQRLSFENLQDCQDLKDPSKPYFNKPEAYAMDRFAYYPCFKCKKAYFGGQRRCDAGDRNDSFNPEDLICGGCSGIGVEECSKHGKEFMEHKCQYCCSVASWFCWGKTHFCDPCHTRQQKGDYISRYTKDKHPVCPGKEQCPLKIDHAPNGDPFCLGCVVCRNMPDY